MSLPFKSHRGWQQQTDIPGPGNLTTRVLTMKRSSGELVTTAVEGVKAPDSFTHAWDATQSLLRSRVRVTEAAVAAQHKEALAALKEKLNAC